MGTFGILSKLSKLPLSTLRYPQALGISKFYGRRLYSVAALAYQSEDDEWDDLSSAALRNSYRYHPTTPDNLQAINFKATSASGLDLTSNCLVQQMLFNSHLRRTDQSNSPHVHDILAAPFSTSSNSTGTNDVGGANEIPPENQEEEEHIHRLDLCVGKIIEAERHPSAEYLYIERIDIGDSPDPRIIVSGLVRYIPQQELVGRNVVVVRNMKPSKLRGIISHGMLLCASKDGKVELLEPPQGSVPGDKIFFDGFPGEPDRILNPKKKIFEKVSPHFWTDENRICMYKNSPFKTKHGLVTVKSIVKGTIS